MTRPRKPTTALRLSPRERLAATAQEIANLGRKKIQRGARIFVVVTDEDGEWVGVGSNTTSDDVAAILNSALLGADRVNHRGLTGVVDTDGEST